MTASTDPQTTSPLYRHLLRWTGFCLLALLLVAGTGWTMAALWFQAPESFRLLLMAGAAVIGLGLLVVSWRRQRLAWLGTVLMVAVVALWWSSILPTHNRDWAADVAHIVAGRVEGHELVLYNVRNFEWRSEDDFTPRWETRRYNLDELETVDLFSSVWASPAIAHTLISFGFENGEHIVFSIEIRRKKGEAFSAIGGFFKQFELALIASDENDIIRLRSDARGETVSLFPLKVTPEQARHLLLTYVALGNELSARPEFYQTLTSNCTTIIYQLARLVEPGIPFDWRILLSGYLPDYLHAHGLLKSDLPLDEIKRQAVIPAQNGRTEPYSRAIRTR